MEFITTQIKKYQRPISFSLLILPFSIIGGYFVGIYYFDSATEDVKEQILQQVKSKNKFYLITTLQSTTYGLFCSFNGYLLSNSIGQMKPLTFDKRILKKVGIITFFLGLLFPLDYYIFGYFNNRIRETTERITIANFICSLFYGGIIEEIIMRLFLMSLITFLLWKIIARQYSKEQIPFWIRETSNIITALLFAALHLPATISFFGGLTPLLIFRCFLLNGFFALFFGHFYIKYGIQYAIICHAGVHFVSKVVFLIVL